MPLPVVAVDPTPESLAVGMGAVLGAPEEAAARAARARAAVESRYAWDRVVDRLERLYLNVSWRAA